MVKRILGLDVNDYNTSAALLIDGKIVSAAQEERFNREKLSRRFPLNAIEFCLKDHGLTYADLDAIAVSVNPAIYLEALNSAQSERARYRGEILYGVPNYLLGLQKGIHSTITHLNIELENRPPLPIHYITHHDAHAGIGYFASPFEKAAILSVDGFGETETAVYYKAEGNRITRIKQIEFPHSIGLFYAAMTEYLGFRPFHEEWKIMGASAYGDSGRYDQVLRKLLRYTKDGDFEVELSYFNYYQFHRPGSFHQRITELLGEPYIEGAGETDQRFFDIAAGVQAVTEDVVMEMLNYLHGRFPVTTLCLTGGVALNCVLNGKISIRTPFQSVFVPPMPDDSGTSLGAALWAYKQIYHGENHYVMEHNYLGPSYETKTIEAELKRCKLPYEQLPSPAKTGARLIFEGKIIGWFQGGMEFGDRALGNRSILADPRNPETKERLNDQIKFRESFRPFAPSVLEEYKGDYFHNPVSSPFMEKALLVREDKRNTIPSVTHVDGTARLQTVTRGQNPLFCKLLEEFHSLSGLPMVLNTSFNIKGEPIVCSPRDAIRTFYTCGLDALIIDCFLIEKKGP